MSLKDELGFVEVKEMAYKKLPWQTGLEMVAEAVGKKTDYENSYPYNVGAYINGVHYGDCWNFIKALIWAWSVGLRLFKDRVNNTFFYDGRSSGKLKSYNGIGASGLGDVNGATIMSYCDGGGTTNFRTLVPMMVLYKPGHMALYTGNYELNGYIYNACEYNVLTSVGDGLLPFWIDVNGYKYYHKNGNKTGARFTMCGKLSRWIDYSDAKEKTGTALPEKLHTGALAVAIMSGILDGEKIGNGEDRKKFLTEKGYTEAEIEKAQKVVDYWYGKKGQPLTKEECKVAMRDMGTPKKEQLQSAARNLAMDDNELIALLAWVQGEGYWEDAVNDPYLAYLSACVMINNIIENAYGKDGEAVLRRIASWGSYYSIANQKTRAYNCSAKAMKAAYLAMLYLQKGIHCCYGPGYKPGNTFYDPNYTVQGEHIYVF